MSTPGEILPRDQVAERFAVSTAVLIRFEARGLVRSVRLGSVEGYEPSEIRRIWSVLSLQRDLGINLAGVEAILKLRAQLDDLHARLGHLARRLREVLDEGGADDDRG